MKALRVHDDERARKAAYRIVGDLLGTIGVHKNPTVERELERIRLTMLDASRIPVAPRARKAGAR